MPTMQDEVKEIMAPVTDVAPELNTNGPNASPDKPAIPVEVTGDSQMKAHYGRFPSQHNHTAKLHSLLSQDGIKQNDMTVSKQDFRRVLFHDHSSPEHPFPLSANHNIPQPHQMPDLQCQKVSHLFSMQYCF
jgi:hypothetical protein